MRKFSNVIAENNLLGNILILREYSQPTPLTCTRPQFNIKQGLGTYLHVQEHGST